MKTKKGFKRIAALLMCVVLLATSLPIALAANGEYNPAPYFTDEAQKEGAAAWIDDDGDLQIRFPAATGRPTHANWKLNPNTSDVKAIDYYIVEVSDLGKKLEKHNSTPPVLLSKTVAASAVMALAEGNTLSTVFTAEEIGGLLNMETNRYNVAITAVDEAGWNSMTLDALIFEVPEFQFDMSKFEFLTEDPYAMREMMLFNTSSGYTGYEQTGDTADQFGRVNYTGAVDPETDVKSTGYRLRIKTDGAQTFDTPETRQTWDFSGADEAWFWMDLSDVELKGVSFRLRANYKRIDYNLYNGAVNSTSQHYDSTVYSTLGTQFNTYAAGEEPYVLVQNENGNWEKVMMQNGTVDLSHTKGYVRIPIQFFCSETETQVTSKNTLFGQKQSFNNIDTRNTYFGNNAPLGDWSWVDNNTTDFKGNYATIDPAGTPISDALLIQQGRVYANRTVILWEKNDYSYDMGSFLAPGITNEDINKTTDNNPRRATLVQDASGAWTVQNKENGYKALEDVYSAGIAYTGVGEGTTNNSIFLDNIMFLRQDGQQWTEAAIDGFDGKTTGAPIATYYDQRLQAQSLIFDAIDELITYPSWTSYRAVQYVMDMINAYYNAYAEAVSENYAKQYFTLAKLSARAAAIGRTDTWNKFRTAERLCSNSQMLDGNNSRPNDIVPILVRSLEALPDPSTVTSISDTLRDEVIKCYQAYTCLNFGQLKMFGSYTVENEDGSTMLYEEEKLLAYVQLLADQLSQNTVTGYKMANYPFIPFNTFEENTEIGDMAWKVEDDPNYNDGGYLADWQHTKNFTTTTTGDKKIVDGKDQTINYLYSDVHTYAHAGDAEVTDSGYNGTKGLTSTISSGAVQGDANGGVFYTVQFNRDSVSGATDFNTFKANNMSSINLGELAKNNNSALTESKKNPDGSIYLPFALVMYVDFSDLNDENGAGDFTFGVKIHTMDGDGNSIAYRPAMGSQIGGNKYWRSYFILDQDPTSTNFGEWKRVFVKDRGWTSGNYMFPSKTTNPQDGEEPASLAGYKGYIAIPMNHFKRGGTDGDFLVENATALNNIYSIRFGISNASGAAMAGKSFTIDNVGFTYDPDYYQSEFSIDTTTRNDPSYAEVFGAKSSKSVDFETAVAAIDPYAPTDDFKAAYVAALNIYNNELKDWQKQNVATVQQAKALLDVYTTYYDGTATPPPSAMSVDELKAAIAALPANIPTDTIQIQPLPNPGFIANADPTKPGEVNYAGFDFESKAQAEEIVKYYTDSYKRLSVADMASLTADEKEKLLDAYNAAMRCLGTLEMIKENATDFAGKLAELYKAYTDDGQTLRFIKASDRNQIAELSSGSYDPLAYYAKVGLSGDNEHPAYSVVPAYSGMTNGLARYLANVKTNDAGEVTGGGVKVLMDKYTQLYQNTKTALDSKQLLSDELYAELKEAIAEYNDLIPAYKNIFELYYGSVEADASGQYQGIKDILELFPVYDAAFSDGTAEQIVNLTEGSLTQTVNLHVNYAEELPSDAVNCKDLTFTATYDGVLKSTDGTVTTDYTFSWDGKEVAPGEEVAIPQDVANNTYTESNPLAIPLTVEAKSLGVLPMSGKVTVTAYRPAKANEEPDKTVTNGETVTNLKKVGTYTITVNTPAQEGYFVYIPAEIPVDWDTTTPVDVSYSVTTAMADASSITVDITAAQGELIADGAPKSIPYAAANFAATESFSGTVSDAKPTLLPTITIDEGAWKDIPVAKYKDTLTYTVTYNTINETP